MPTPANQPDVLLLGLCCIAIFCFYSFPVVIFSWLSQSNRRLTINPCRCQWDIPQKLSTWQWKMLIWSLAEWSVQKQFSSVQFSSFAQSSLTLCDPMNRSTPGLPVHHQLPEFTQTHVHRVDDAIQPSHPLSSPSPPAPNPSQHQSLFQWVNSSHEVAKVLEFQL